MFKRSSAGTLDKKPTENPKWMSDSNYIEVVVTSLQPPPTVALILLSRLCASMTSPNNVRGKETSRARFVPTLRFAFSLFLKYVVGPRNHGFLRPNACSSCSPHSPAQWSLLQQSSSHWIFLCSSFGMCVTFHWNLAPNDFFYWQLVFSGRDWPLCTRLETLRTGLAQSAPVAHIVRATLSWRC